MVRSVSINLVFLLKFTLGYMELINHRGSNPLPFMLKGKSNFKGEKHHHRGIFVWSWCVSLNDKGEIVEHIFIDLFSLM